MSVQNPVSYTEWYQSLPIPWLVSGPNGKAEATALGTVLDGELARLKQSAKVSFPDNTPSDGLPHIGGDRQLYQGPTETNANFITRLKTAWDDWARAGTFLELLVQLFWQGFTGAVIVQQNGLAYSLSGSPTAGVDPTPLLTITNLGVIATALTSNITPPTATQTGRAIPAGNSWWTFDNNTDQSSRFAILFTGVLPSFFVTSAVATFTGVEDGSVANPWPLATWNNTFPDTTYKIQPGAVTITDGLGPIVVSADLTTKTMTSVRIAASASFVGTVDVLAWQAGANPFADLHPADLARLQLAIKTWRPNATCGGTPQTGVVALTQGQFWQSVPSKTWGSGGNWGPSTVASFQGA